MIVQEGEVIESTAVVWVDPECMQEHVLRLGQLLCLQVDQSEIEGCSGIVRLS